MNPLDLGVVAVIVLSAIFAFARGFVREALSIVAWVAAALITLYGFNTAFALIEPHVQNPLLSQVIAGCGLFIISLVILTIVTGILARMVHATGLTPIDRTLGFVFGVARGAFLVCLAYLLLDMSVQPNDRPPWIREARSAPYLHDGASALQGLLPEQLKVKSAEISDQLQSPETKKAAADLAKDARNALVTPAPPAAAPTTPAAPPVYTQSQQKQLKQQFIRTEHQ